jgi:hypothetical protein
VSALWIDRLVEVWASPGVAGAGVLVGSHGVLTARHVVAGALTGDRVLARVVRPHRGIGAWVRMTVPWQSVQWDLALLAVDQSAPEAPSWLIPDSPNVVIAELGAGAEPGCEAVGFPDAVVQPVRDGKPSLAVRQTEQVRGVVLPAGQGKPPQAPDRPLPHAWMPLDAETTSPSQAVGWGGMSGAAVVLPHPDGRLLGVVATAEPRDQRRLYVVPLAAALPRAEGLAGALASAGGPVGVEVRDARLFRTVLHATSLDGRGAPLQVHELDDLGAFGVKPADVPGEATYLDYVPRDDDQRLRDHLREAIGSRRALLVVGGSAAGKSRSAAEAARRELPRYRLLRPRYGQLQTLLSLPRVALLPGLVWLDNIDRYKHSDLAETLRGLLDAGLAVVATIRRAQYDEITRPGDIRDPAGEALTDPTLVLQQRWPLAWSEDERGRLRERVKDPALLAAAERGVLNRPGFGRGSDLARRLRPCQHHASTTRRPAPVPYGCTPSASVILASRS